MTIEMALNGNIISGYNQDYYSEIIEKFSKDSKAIYVAAAKRKLETCLFKQNIYNPLCRKIIENGN